MRLGSKRCSLSACRSMAGPTSDRVPGKDLVRAIERYVGRRECFEYAFRHRLRCPPVSRVRGANRAWLAEQVDLVVADAENLTGRLATGFACERNDEWRNSLRLEASIDLEASLVLRSL